ncbi:MAG: dihydrofolate reductase family protein [Candidatus Dormibacteraeota bacterium]|nr:dihydrofolate reductase family protein [Candidatus Dormibacteraeota bacterium]
MNRVIVFNHITLDGVMQAPGRPDEDRRGGFEHGGWAASRMDSAIGRKAAEGMAEDGALLLGRRTYEDFAAFWPNQKDNPFTEVLNNKRKYVASRTLAGPLRWSNSTLLEGDAEEAVAKLKEQSGLDLTVLGSGELVQSLMRRNLIDQYQIIIHPLVLGSGRRLFADGGPSVHLRLVDSQPSSTGAVIATYEPDERSRQ